jgi:hypothetical protein
MVETRGGAVLKRLRVDCDDFGITRRTRIARAYIWFHTVGELDVHWTNSMPGAPASRQRRSLDEHPAPGDMRAIH